MPDLRRIVKDVARRWAGVDITSSKRLPSWDVWQDIRQLHAQKDLRVIFDIGAHYGETARAMREHFPHAMIYSFEPAGDAYDALRAGVANDPRIVPVHAAVSDQLGEVQLHRSLADVCHSLRTTPELATGSTERVEAITTDSFCRSQAIGHVDLLKTDTEGWDAHVLRGAHTMLSSGAIDTIVAEVTFNPSDDHHTHFSALFEQLEPHGFMFMGLYDVVWALNGRRCLHYANALFTRV